MLHRNMTHSYLSSLLLVCTMLVLTACGGTMSEYLSSGSSGHKSHGPSIHGYGPIAFGTPRDVAFQAIQGRGQFEHLPGQDAQVLSYFDYIDYLQVRVVQYFNESGKSTKAEVYVLGAENGAKTLNECKGFYTTMYSMMQRLYGEPDWSPRTDSRRYGESGVLMYTFADSSNISLSYDYVTREQQDRAVGLCTVKLGYNPPWAT